ncbi:Os01g0554100, partial [Oryza sativa Japonica Group]
GNVCSFQEVKVDQDHIKNKNYPKQSIEEKLGRNAVDLIKTNMVLKVFGGNPSETKGVLNVELTVGSKTIPTTIFVIDGKGSYNLLLGRDWIHANCCIPSTMHQCLIQWQGDKIEVVPADRSVNVASADLALWEMDGLDCLSGKVWDGDFLKVSDSDIQPIEDGEPKLLL